MNMLKTPVDQLVNELKNQPYTMLVLIALCAIVTWGTLNYAQAEDLKKLSTRVDTYGAKIDRVLSLQIAEAIRTTHTQYCTVNGDLIKMNLQRTIDTLQADYSELAGEMYPLNRC